MFTNIGAKPKIQQGKPTISKEEALKNLRERRVSFEVALNKCYDNVGFLDEQIRELLAKGNKQFARSKIAEMKGVQQQIAEFSRRCNAIIKMILEIEVFEQDAILVETIEAAAKIATANEDVNIVLQEGLINQKEAQISQKETDNIWKQLAQQVFVDNDELENDLKAFEQKMEEEKIEEFEEKFKLVPNIIIKKCSMPKQQISKQVQQVIQS